MSGRVVLLAQLALLTSVSALTSAEVVVISEQYFHFVIFSHLFSLIFNIMIYYDTDILMSYRSA